MPSLRRFEVRTAPISSIYTGDFKAFLREKFGYTSAAGAPNSRKLSLVYGLICSWPFQRKSLSTF